MSGHYLAAMIEHETTIKTPLQAAMRLAEIVRKTPGGASSPVVILADEVTRVLEVVKRHQDTYERASPVGHIQAAFMLLVNEIEGK